MGNLIKYLALFCFIFGIQTANAQAEGGQNLEDQQTNNQSTSPEESSNNNNSTNPPKCDPKCTPKEVSKSITKENLFGEQADNYTVNTVTYILDFKPRESSDNQILYKVFKVHESTGCSSCMENPRTYTGVYNNEKYSTRSQKIYRRDCENLIMVRVGRSEEHIPDNSEVLFKVVHINRFVYEVSIERSLEAINTQPSDQFSRLFLGSDSDVLTGLMEQVSNNLTNVKNSALKIDSAEGDDSIASLAEEVLDFYLAYDRLEQRLINIYRGSCTEFEDCPDYDYEFSGLVQKRRGLVTDINQLITATKPELEKRKASTEACSTKLKALWDSYTALESLRSSLDQDKENHQEFKKKFQSSSGLSEEEKKAYTDRLDNMFKAIVAKEQEIIEKESTFKSLKAELASQKYLGREVSTVSEFKTVQDSLNLRLKEFESNLTVLNALDQAKDSLPNIDKIKEIYKALSLANAYSQQYTATVPAFDNSRSLSINLEIKATDLKSESVLVPNKSDYTINYKFPYTKYWYLTFSSGIYVGLGNYRSTLYGWQKIPNANGIVNGDSDVRYQLSEIGRRTTPLGFQSLGHLLYRCKPGQSYGLATGVGLSLDQDPRLAYMLGGSAAFGKSRQIVFNAGLMISQDRELKNNLFPDAVYATNNEKIEYYTRYQPGFFFSLTFTPFQVQSEEAKTSEDDQ